MGRGPKFIALALIWAGILFCNGRLRAQNEHLRLLIEQKEPDCDSLDEQSLKEIMALEPVKENAQLKNIYEFWKEYCSPNEAMIRTGLLLDYQNDLFPPKLKSLYAYFPYYFQFLKRQENKNLAPKTDARYLRYTQNWSAELIKQQYRADPPVPLQLFAATDLYQIDSVIYAGSNDNVEGIDSLRKRRHRQATNNFMIDLGAYYQQYTGGLADKIMPGGGFLLGVSFDDFNRHRAGVFATISLHNFSNNVRFQTRDTLQASSGNFSFSLGGYYSGLIHSWGRSQLRFQVSLAYEGLPTGLSEERIDEQGNRVDQSVIISSYNIGSGLEFDFPLGFHRNIGLFCTFHLIDYNLGTTALTDLSGNYFRAGLRFHL